MAKPWVNALKTICIDYNGVLDLYEGYREAPYPPRPGAREFLENLCNAGYRVVIFTAADVAGVQQFLLDNDMFEFVDLITNEKVPAIVYVDDRAVNFSGNFAETYHEILNFIPYWERGNHNGKG
jgi:hypothetical protein